MNDPDQWLKALSETTALQCECTDWAECMPKINGPIVLAAIRAGRSVYDGKTFVYCPWCGRKLSK